MIELLRQRRSIRSFTDAPVSAEHLHILQEAALRSPSSRHRMPWRFIFTQNPARLHALSQCKTHGAAFLAQCPLGIAVCADPDRADTWIEDASIAAITLQYTAHSLGLGNCWVQVRLRGHAEKIDAEDHVRAVLDLEDTWRVLCILGIGHPAENPPPRPDALLHREKLALIP